MAIGASGDGEFISKYDDGIIENDDKSKRSVKDDAEEVTQRKAVLPVKVAKRSAGKSKKGQKRDKTPAVAKGVARGPQELDVEVLMNIFIYLVFNKESSHLFIIL